MRLSPAVAEEHLVDIAYDPYEVARPLDLAYDIASSIRHISGDLGRFAAAKDIDLRVWLILWTVAHGFHVDSPGNAIGRRRCIVSVIPPLASCLTLIA